MADKQQTAHKSVQAAVLAAKKNMGQVFKNASNPHFKSKYADLANIVEAVEGPLQDEGVLLTQPLMSEEDQLFIETTLHHVESDTKMISKVKVVAAVPSDPQKVGSAVTYYRRYSLQSLLGIAPEDDDGNAASAQASRAESRPAPKPPAASAITQHSIEERIPCDVPACKNSISGMAEKKNREMHDGHAICKFHHENGDWKASIAGKRSFEDVSPVDVAKEMGIEPPANDPNFVDPDSLPL